LQLRVWKPVEFRRGRATVIDDENFALESQTLPVRTLPQMERAFLQEG